MFLILYSTYSTLKSSTEYCCTLVLFNSVLKVLSSFSAVMYQPRHCCFKLAAGHPGLKIKILHDCTLCSVVVVQSPSRSWLFATPWTAACQASLSFTVSWSLLRLRSIESMMPSNHLILYQPLLLPPSIFPSIRVFSSESAVCIRWTKYWSFSISPPNEYSGFDFLYDWLVWSPSCPRDSQESSPTPQ